MLNSYALLLMQHLQFGLRMINYSFINSLLDMLYFLLIFTPQGVGVVLQTSRLKHFKGWLRKYISYFKGFQVFGKQIKYHKITYYQMYVFINENIFIPYSIWIMYLIHPGLYLIRLLIIVWSGAFNSLEIDYAHWGVHSIICTRKRIDIVASIAERPI